MSELRMFIVKILLRLILVVVPKNKEDAYLSLCIGQYAYRVNKLEENK